MIEYRCELCGAVVFVKEDTLATPPRQGRDVTLYTCACVLERIRKLENELSKKLEAGWQRDSGTTQVSWEEYLKQVG